MNKIHVTDEELATILAALRYYQRKAPDTIPFAIRDIATDCGSLKPLTEDQIDHLCERLKTI